MGLQLIRVRAVQACVGRSRRTGRVGIVEKAPLLDWVTAASFLFVVAAASVLGLHTNGPGGQRRTPDAGTVAAHTALATWPVAVAAPARTGDED